MNTYSSLLPHCRIIIVRTRACIGLWATVCRAISCGHVVVANIARREECPRVLYDLFVSEVSARNTTRLFTCKLSVSEHLTSYLSGHVFVLSSFWMVCVLMWWIAMPVVYSSVLDVLVSMWRAGHSCGPVHASRELQCDSSLVVDLKMKRCIHNASLWFNINIISVYGGVTGDLHVGLCSAANKNWFLAWRVRRVSSPQLHFLSWSGTREDSFH